MRDSDWHGWVIKGDGNTFRKDKSLDKLGVGFALTVGDGARGEGFQKDEDVLPGDATDTRLAACKAKGNRRDVAVVTAFCEFDVSFTTGGNDPGQPGHQPEVED